MAVNTNARKNPSSTEAANELTEEEIAAMPGSDYMNETQTAFFRAKLSRLKQEMLDRPTGALDFVRDEPLVVPDPVDRATVQEEKTLELDARDRNHAFLEKIDQSLARIEAGEYGYYQETRKPGNRGAHWNQAFDCPKDCRAEHRGARAVRAQAKAVRHLGRSAITFT